MTEPAKNAAACFFNLITPAMPLEVLEGYGLNLTIPQAQAITQELVALSAFWIRCALQAGIPEQFGKTIWQSLTEHLQQDWENKFGLAMLSFDKFLGEMDARHAAWDELTRMSAEPIIVINQAASDLEEQGLVPQGHQQFLVALFLDFVPIDEIGNVAKTIEEGRC